MPAIAIPLALLGLVPFVLCAFGAVVADPASAGHLLLALIDYAALVLGFAGGVHWGLALPPGSVRANLRFSAGVLPLIAAWIALVLAQTVAPRVALVLLIAGYLATVLTEHRALRRLLLPPGYVWMRWGFTIVAVVSMLTVLLVLTVRGVGQTIVF